MKKTILISAICAICTQAQSQSWNLGGNAGTDPSTQFIGTTDAKSFKIRTNNNVRVTVTSGGNVGFGTSTVPYKITVASGVNNAIGLDNGASLAAKNMAGAYETFFWPRWTDNKTYLNYGAAGFGIRNNSSALTMFMTNDSKVGIGISSPAFKLDVKNGSINTDSVYRIGGNTVLAIKGNYNTATGVLALFSNTTGGWNTATGSYSLTSNTTGDNNTAIGVEASRFNTTGYNNTSAGAAALYQNTIGYNNTATGRNSLMQNTTGFNNSAIGYKALFNNVSGSNNSAFGIGAINTNISGNYNTALGFYALYNTIGTGNTAIGTDAGNSNTTGTYNTYVGYNAHGNPAITKSIAIGYNATVTASNCIVLGDGTQNVGIGTTAPVYKLEVCGTIRSKEVRVETGWCDYVFADDYMLPALSEVESFIKNNKHLPDVTKGSVIETEGLEVGKVSAQMIRKIEELTLYVIEQEKAINNLKSQNTSLETKFNLLINKEGK